MSRPVTARIFLEGVPRAIKLVDPSTEEVFKAYVDALSGQGPSALQGITVEGARFVCNAFDVRDVLGPVPAPAPAPEAVADDGIFDGRRVTVRDYAAWRRSEERLAAENGWSFAGTWDEYSFPAVVVLGEDLAEVALAVVRPSTGEALWLNPASEDGADERYVRAAVLLAEAETLQNAASEPATDAPALTHLEARYGLGHTEDQLNALAHLERGDVDAARAIAGDDFVDDVSGEVHAAADDSSE